MRLPLILPYQPAPMIQRPRLEPFRRGIAILALLLLHTPASSPESTAQSLWSDPYEEAAVSSADRLASEAGVEIMRMGGNAVDAAVAVKFALAVTVPRAGNIGGGGFMVLRMADGSEFTLDFREKAPIAATRDMYLDENGDVIQGLSLFGHKAAGVPGAVDGMLQAHERFGTLPLHTLLEPAIRLARDGYALSASQAASLNGGAERFAAFEASARQFLHPEGREWRMGDWFTQPDLAGTLERIARDGREGFYGGETAAAIVREMEQGGGLITLDDLAAYRAVWRKPLRHRFQGVDFVAMPPPSSGGVAMAQILQMIEAAGWPNQDPNSADVRHLYAEAMSRAFADRSTHLGDPDYFPVPLDSLLSTGYARSRMSSYVPERHTPSSEIRHGSFAPPSESMETTHFSVIDPMGNAVAVNTTLNGSFGNFVTVGGAGFLLNNEMDDFSIKPGVPNMYGLIGAEANAIEPGKRMLSSMTPVIAVRDGKTVLVSGGAGGPRIITAVMQTALNVLHFGMNAQEAIHAPRVHHQWLPDVLFHETNGLSTETMQTLRSYGYELREVGGLARVHMLVVDEEGRIHGGADPRGGGGHVAGY